MTDDLHQKDIEALSYFGYSPDDPVAGWVEVPTVMEATAAVVFPLDGVDVAIVGRRGKILGTLAHKDSAIVKARPEFFQGLRLPLAYGAEEKRSRR